MTFKENLKFWAVLAPLLLAASFGIMRCQEMNDKTERPKRSMSNFLTPNYSKIQPETKHWKELHSELEQIKAQQTEMESSHESLPPGTSINSLLPGTWRGTRKMTDAGGKASIPQVNPFAPGLTQSVAMVDVCRVSVTQGLLQVSFFDQIPADETENYQVNPSSSDRGSAGTTKLSHLHALVDWSSTDVGGIIVTKLGFKSITGSGKIYGDLDGTKLTLTVFKVQNGVTKVRSYTMTKT